MLRPYVFWEILNAPCIHPDNLCDSTTMMCNHPMQTIQPLSPSCDDMEVESECTIFTLACLETVPTDPDAVTCNFIDSSDELLWLNLLHVDSTTSCVLTNICQAVGTKGLLMSITSHHGTPSSKQS
jgi:hypothetical protein